MQRTSVYCKTVLITFLSFVSAPLNMLNMVLLKMSSKETPKMRISNVYHICRLISKNFLFLVFSLTFGF